MIAGRILRMNRAFEGEGRIADEDGARTRTASIDPLPSFALVLVRELTTKVALTCGQDRDADHAGPAKLRPGGRLALDGKCDERRGKRDRSDVHTSELQSLIRISYACFSLKKKKTK